MPRGSPGPHRRRTPPTRRCGPPAEALVRGTHVRTLQALPARLVRTHRRGTDRLRAAWRARWWDLPRLRDAWLRARRTTPRSRRCRAMPPGQPHRMRAERSRGAHGRGRLDMPRGVPGIPARAPADPPSPCPVRQLSQLLLYASARPRRTGRVMTCVSDDDLLAFVEGRLAPQRVSEVEAHLLVCDA